MHRDITSGCESVVVAQWFSGTMTVELGPITTNIQTFLDKTLL
jgi:hypothetical protein